MIEWNALGSVLTAGLILGAGLPALFALGVKLLTPVASGPVVTPVTGARKFAGYACFGVCLLAVVAGVVFLAYGGHS
ncbi:hypothetical protein [Timonella senegalensis]|uniref:hypothetical protein n=1 Tax=Timonella senegalensis TaxID=1465825 RepID=UPI0028B252DA|nr:hypothetical protein [Timonella senegalensis]